MKTKNLLIVIVVIFSITCSIIYSCTKLSSTSSCNKCNVRSSETKMISLNIEGQKIHEMPIKYYKAQYMNTTEKYEMGKMLLSGELFKKISKQLINANENITSYAIVLYLDKTFINKNSIDISDVIAFSVFSLLKNDTQMHHNLFILFNNHFVENKAYEIDVSNITVNQLSFQLNEAIPMVLGKKLMEKSYILLFDCTHIYSKTKYGRDEFKHLYNTYRAKFSYNKSTNPGSWVCPDPCPVLEGRLCIERAFCDPQCENYYWDPCASTDQSNFLLSNNLMSEDSVKQAYDSTSFYIIKDSILKPYKLGLKYIEYYYTISEALRKTNLPTSLIISTAKTSIQCHQMFQLLNTPLNNPNSVFLSTTQRDALITLINQYKLLFTDQNILNILNDIKSDLNKYTGYTIGNFITEIQR